MLGNGCICWSGALYLSSMLQLAATGPRQPESVVGHPFNQAVNLTPFKPALTDTHAQAGAAVDFLDGKPTRVPQGCQQHQKDGLPDVVCPALKTLQQPL